MRGFLAALVGLIVTLPASAQWTRVELGVTDLFAVAFLASDADYLYAAVLTGQPVLSRVAVARSGDDGASWQTVFTGVPGARIASFVHLDGQMAAILTGGGQAALFTSDDQGGTWTLAAGRFPGAGTGLARMGATYVAVGQNPSYRSTDGGATWAPFGQNQPMAGALAFGGTFYGFSGIGQVYRLDGDAWTQINVGVPFVTDLWVEGGTLWAKASAGTLVSSSDGATWAAQSTAVPISWNLVIYDQDDNRPWFLHSAAAATDLLLSDDQGTTATSIAAGYPRDDNGGICVSGYAISRAAVLGNALCSFTEPERNGVFRYAFGTVASDAGPSRDDASLTVAGNPTRGAANARLTLGSPAQVAVVVVDALGRTVAPLVDGLIAAGNHALHVPSGLAPGVYAIVAEVNGRRVARTFTVVR